jgi:hypothetical protein
MLAQKNATDIKMCGRGLSPDCASRKNDPRA